MIAYLEQLRRRRSSSRVELNREVRDAFAPKRWNSFVLRRRRADEAGRAGRGRDGPVPDAVHPQGLAENISTPRSGRRTAVGLPAAERCASRVRVLVVGGGNTGFQIAKELSATHRGHCSPVGSRQKPLAAAR